MLGTEPGFLQEQKKLLTAEHLSSPIFIFWGEGGLMSKAKTKDDFEFLVFLFSPPQFWDHKHGAAHIVYYCAGARTQGFLHVRQALYQLSYVCSHALKLLCSHLSRARIIGVPPLYNGHHHDQQNVLPSLLVLVCLRQFGYVVLVGLVLAK